VDTVAEETARLARAVGARAVVVAGEVRARSAVLAALPHPASDVAVEAQAGGRAAGADALRREVDRVLGEVRQADRRALLATYDGGMLRGNRPSRAQEWRDPEPPADDDPELHDPSALGGPPQG